MITLCFLQTKTKQKKHWKRSSRFLPEVNPYKKKNVSSKLKGSLYLCRLDIPLLFVAGSSSSSSSKPWKVEVSLSEVVPNSSSAPVKVPSSFSSPQSAGREKTGVRWWVKQVSVHTVMDTSLLVCDVFYTLVYVDSLVHRQAAYGGPALPVFLFEPWHLLQ